jgi:hypothetical protein
MLWFKYMFHPVEVRGAWWPGVPDETLGLGRGCVSIME